MKKIFTCRRTVVALYAITLLAGLSAYLRIDLSGSIAMVAIALGAANASQAILEKKNVQSHQD